MDRFRQSLPWRSTRNFTEEAVAHIYLNVLAEQRPYWQEPKTSRFLLFRRKFRSVFSLWCLFVELWPRFKATARAKCAFELLFGHFVQAPAAPKTARVSQNGRNFVAEEG